MDNRNDTVATVSDSRAGKAWQKPFGRKRSSILLLFIGIGLSTVFIPLIKVQPAVMDRMDWSAFETLYELCNGTLHFDFVRGPYFFPLAPIELAAVYLALLVALLLLLARIPGRLFMLVTFFVASLCLAVGLTHGRTSIYAGPRFGDSFTYDLECVSYKDASQHLPGYFGHVNCTQLLAALLSVSLGITLTSWFSNINR